ncbi:MAG TPA: hypothetical protein VMG10_26300 [Gemmataceae bacterium]|nr:hypothetical protein [Gemmataceae bacterium]
MADRDMPEFTLLYGKLGAVGIVGGLLMTTPLLEMYWQGIVAISIGLVALGMAIKGVFSRRSRCLDREDCDDGANAAQVAADVTMDVKSRLRDDGR